MGSDSPRMPKWHNDDNGSCILPHFCIEANTMLSQEMVLHWELPWEQPEEPRAGAAAQTDASTDTTRLSSAEQAATRSEHEKPSRAAVKDWKFWG